MIEDDAPIPVTHSHSGRPRFDAVCRVVLGLLDRAERSKLNGAVQIEISFQHGIAQKAKGGLLYSATLPKTPKGYN